MRLILALGLAVSCYGQQIFGPSKIVGPVEIPNPSGGGGGTIALVAHTAALDTADTYPYTSSSINCTGANFVAIAITNVFVPVSSLSLSDSLGHVAANFKFTTDQSYGGAGNNYLGLAYLENITGSTGYTVTIASASAQNGSLVVSCWSGVASSSSLDQQNSNNAISSGTTFQAGSVTSTVNGELALNFVLYNVTSGTLTIDSSYTILGQIPRGGSGTFGIALAYLIQSVAGATNPTWTTTTSMIGLASAATFKP